MRDVDGLGGAVASLTCPPARPHVRSVRAGTLVVDAGAARAVVSRKSLFAAGIVRVEGRFSAQDGVRLASQDGHELARGVCNYSSAEVARLLGRRSADMAAVLGWQGPEEVVHRSAIAVTHAAGDPGAWGGGGAARAAPGGEEERDGVDGRAFTPAPADPSPAPAASAVEGLRWDARVDADSAAGTGTGQGEAARGADHAAGAATGSGAAAPGPRGDGGRDPPAEDPIRMDPIAADAGAGSAALREGEAGPAEEAGGSR